MNHLAKSLVLLFFCTFGSLASATVIDFEDVLPLQTGVQTSRGYIFSGTVATGDIVSVTANGGTFCAGSPCSTNGTQNLFAYNEDQTAPFQVNMRAQNGSAFQLLGFDFSELFNFTVRPGAFILLTGQTTLGGTVTASFEYDVLPNAFQTVQVLGFTNLTSVLFTSDRYFPAYDNIVVNAVPLPPTLVLCLLAFAGTGLMSRRPKI